MALLHHHHETVRDEQDDLRVEHDDVRVENRDDGQDPGRIHRQVVAASIITALGGLLFGYDTGVVSGALLFLKNDFGGLSSFQQELVTSLLLVGAMVGALAAGRVADVVGRRPTILATALIFVVGVLLAAFAPAYWTLILARFVIGLAVGSASMSVPLYIGEVAPPKLRGGLVSFNQLDDHAGNPGLVSRRLRACRLGELAPDVRARRHPRRDPFRRHPDPEGKPALAGPAGPRGRGTSGAAAGCVPSDDIDARNR